MAREPGPWVAAGYRTRAEYRAAVRASGQRSYPLESARRRAREGTGYGHGPAARQRREQRFAALGPVGKVLQFARQSPSSNIRIFIYGYSRSEPVSGDWAERTYGAFEGQVVFRASAHIERGTVIRGAEAALASGPDGYALLLEFLHPLFMGALRVDLIGIEKCTVFDTATELGQRGPFRHREIWP